MAAMHYIVDWILPFLIVLTVLIFVHELGHYLVARLCGVMIEVFSIGFGPELFGWTDRAGTRWRVSAIPLGGFVKMHGEDTFAEETQDAAPADADQRFSFRHKTLKQRAAIVSAGPLANILFALVLLLGLFTFVGAPALLPVVGTVQEGSAAAEARLMPGDLILEIDGEKIVWFDDIRRIVNSNPGVQLRFRVQRGHAEIEIAATPRETTASTDGETRKVGLLGIKPDLARIGYQELSLPDAVVAAVGQTYNLATQIVDSILNMIRGGNSLDELGGPLRIAQISGQVAQHGIINLLYFMAALSVNLALINLLPIPVLDGGHLLLYAVEGAIGKPLNKRVIEYAFRAGLVFVVCLMLLATWNDLISLQVIDFFRKLVS
jgi:regulator of sigma E protease